MGAVGCLNNDRTVMSCPYAWRPLGLLPILKPGAFTNNNVEWQRHRRLELYHRCMDPVIAQINTLCSEDKYFRFADRRVRVVASGTCSAWTAWRLQPPLCAAQMTAPSASVPRTSWTKQTSLIPLETEKKSKRKSKRHSRSCLNQTDASNVTALDR